MLVSIGNSPEYREGSRTQYFIGDFDGTVFKKDASSETVRWLDGGRDNYAGVSWSDIPSQDGRRIYIGWMSNWKIRAGDANGKLAKCNDNLKTFKFNKLQGSNYFYTAASS